MAEVVAFEEEWEGAGFGQGVGGAVAEVEGCGVAAFAVAQEGLAGEFGQGSVLGDDLDAGAGAEGVVSAGGGVVTQLVIIVILEPARRRCV